MSAPQPSPERRFFGAALMAVGGLIAALCGSCTVILSVAMIVESLNYPRELFSMLLMFLVVGGVPTLLGLMLFCWGRRLRRPPTSNRPKNLAVFSDEPGAPS